MDIYVINIIKQVLLIYTGNFFLMIFIRKLVGTQITIHSGGSECGFCVHLIMLCNIFDHCKLCFQM